MASAEPVDLLHRSPSTGSTNPFSALWGGFCDPNNSSKQDSDDECDDFTTYTVVTATTASTSNTLSTTKESISDKRNGNINSTSTTQKTDVAESKDIQQKTVESTVEGVSEPPQADDAIVAAPGASGTAPAVDETIKDESTDPSFAQSSNVSSKEESTILAEEAPTSEKQTADEQADEKKTPEELNDEVADSENLTAESVPRDMKVESTSMSVDTKKSSSFGGILGPTTILVAIVAILSAYLNPGIFKDLVTIHDGHKFTSMKFQEMKTFVNDRYQEFSSSSAELDDEHVEKEAENFDEEEVAVSQKEEASNDENSETVSSSTDEPKNVSKEIE